MDGATPSYRTFGNFINNEIADSIEEILVAINKEFIQKDNIDLNHLYIDGSKFEANANKYSWVWKKSTEKNRYKLFEKITTLFDEINFNNFRATLSLASYILNYMICRVGRFAFHNTHKKSPSSNTAILTVIPQHTNIRRTNF